MRLYLSHLCSLLDIPLPPNSSGDPAITHVALDSRKVTPEALFACIKGAVTDGHLYAQAAIAAGARLILAERPLPAADVPVLVVKDTVCALQRIATYVRSKTRARVIAVTGTCGKTTVKELIASALARAGTCAKSPGNQNNQLGMACGIINTRGDEDYWVFEAGISHEGDMEALGAMLRPHLALIVNVGEGHTEGLGEKGVAWHKARLLDFLAEGGTGIVSADYPDLVWKAIGTHTHLVFFTAKTAAAASEGPSSSSANFVEWLPEDPDAPGCGQYRLHIQGQHFCVTTPFTGRYACENVIAAATTAHLAGASEAAIRDGFRNVALPGQRFHVEHVGHALVIDDSYNANPLSMTRMLEEAARLAQKKPLVLLLGEMRELGSKARAAHVELGSCVARVAPCALFWKGGFADAVLEGLTEHAYTGTFVPVESPADFRTAFAPIRATHEDLVLLVKGSRANALETCLAHVQDLL